MVQVNFSELFWANFSREEILLGYLRSFRISPRVVAYSASSSQLPTASKNSKKYVSTASEMVTKLGFGVF